MDPRFLRGPLWPLFEWFKDETQDRNKAIDAWIKLLITKAMEDKKMRAGKKLGPEEGSFLDHLAESTSDVRLIRDELMNILLAARDTVGDEPYFKTFILISCRLDCEPAHLHVLLPFRPP